MQSVLDVLDEQNLEKEAEALQKFYASVKMRAAGIDNAEGKQRIIVELYDKFFRNAFPKMTEKLGIVYTPVEVVDFIIHSVSEVLQSEFRQTLGSKGVHIIDPFVGTGTFITRLLHSGLIKPEELAHKYAHEIHANEIVLLAYYIAAINIEAVYHSMSGGDYQPFEGICLTDTFQLYEKEDMISELLVDNGSRRQKQKALDIRVIMSNPPYSVGQTTSNDENANVLYPLLDGRIRSTYAAASKTTNKKALYDSYIRAIRWGSDRLGESGVMAYVSNAGWVDGNVTDGLRKCLFEEFTSLYVFHLRGNQRTAGELSRREGGKIFGSGSRAPIAITLFVKNPDACERGQIHFHDIGDYLSQPEKLDIIRRFGSVEGIARADAWQSLVPDEHNDWLNQRDAGFDAFISLGDKKDKQTSTVFDTYSAGLKTNRDFWCYGSSRSELLTRIEKAIAFFNSEASRLSNQPASRVVGLLDKSPDRFKWCQATLRDVVRRKPMIFDASKARLAMYRPFTKQWVYFDKRLNWSSYLTPQFFPSHDTDNRVICLTGPGGAGDFSVLMSDVLPSFHMADISGGQCFPLHRHPVAKPSSEPSLGLDGESRLDGVTDEALAHFRSAYPGEKISKEDAFHYVYGLLHSEDYRTRFADNLSKQLPRIPCIKKPEDFWSFVKAGRALGELHVNYESVEPYAVNFASGALFMGDFTDADYRVEKMRFGGKGKEKDKSTVIYNSKITMTGIPLEAYDYVINGKPALEWVMERQVVRADKDSGIVNDANLYAIETVGDAAYPLKLFQRVITVSLETMKIVRSLPALDI